MTFELTIVDADDGDCFILTYGEPRRHIVVDGGFRRSYGALKEHLRAWSRQGQSWELLVVTHFDADHIGGILELVADEDLPLRPRQVWFNGFDSLANLQAMHAAHADELSAKLKQLGWPINAHFPLGAVIIGRDGSLPRVMLEGGLELIVLSPDSARLRRLRSDWGAVRSREAIAKKVVAKGHLQVMGGKRRELPDPVDVAALARRTPLDVDVANGSSIAFLACFSGKSVLFTADAHAELLQASLAKLVPAGGTRVRVDVAKLSHHGSMANNPSSLLEMLDCRRFVVSTRGSGHDHPSPETIARVLMNNGPPCTFHFNYRQKWTELWSQAELMEKHGYSCVFDQPTILI